MKELPIDHIPLDVPLSGAMLHLSGETLFDDGQIVSRKHLMLMHMAGIENVALLGPLDKPKRYQAELKTRDVFVTGLKRGERIARAVYDDDHRLILETGMKVDDEAIGALILHDIEKVRVAKTPPEIKAAQLSEFRKLVRRHVEFGEPVAGIDPHDDMESLASYVRAVQHADDLKKKQLPLRLPVQMVADEFKLEPYQHDPERTDLISELFRSIVGHVQALLQAAALHETVNPVDIDKTIDLLQRAFRFDWVDLVCIVARANREKYARNVHTVYVMVLCMLMARELKITEDGLTQLLRAAALHDFGMERIRESLLNKPGALDEDELAEVKRHVVYGLEIADSIKGFDPDISLMIYHSHEEPGGGGYPCGIRRDQIHQGASIIRTAALYSALTAPRPYRPAVFPFSAIAELRNQAGAHHVDGSAVNSLLKALGQYPIGSWVELTELRQGIVVASDRSGECRASVLVSHVAGEKLDSVTLTHCGENERIVYASNPK